MDHVTAQAYSPSSTSSRSSSTPRSAPRPAPRATPRPARPSSTALSIAEGQLAVATARVASLSHACREVVPQQCGRVHPYVQLQVVITVAVAYQISDGEVRPLLALLLPRRCREFL